MPLLISEDPQPVPGEQGVGWGPLPSPKSGLLTPRDLDLCSEALSQMAGIAPPSALPDIATIRQQLLQAYPSEDPAAKIAIELVVEAVEEFQQVCRLHLEPRRGLLLLDVEHKIKRRAACHSIKNRVRVCCWLCPPRYFKYPEFTVLCLRAGK